MSPQRQQAPVEIEYTPTGYLLLTAGVAQQFFPNDSLVLMVKGDEMWMLPTRGAAAGGLLLKQRNSMGDRSVLAAPYLPEDTAPGRWPGFWDDRAAALRVAFRLPAVPLKNGAALDWTAPFGRGSEAAYGAGDRLEPAIAAKGIVELEQGRWVVYLDLGFSSPRSAELRIERRRIADYSTEQRARVAASWIERTADRDQKRPNLGF